MTALAVDLEHDAVCPIAEPLSTLSRYGPVCRFFIT